MRRLRSDYAALVQEGIVFEARNVLITQRSRRFSGPTRVAVRRMRTSPGRFVVTRSRIYAHGWLSLIVNAPCDRTNIDLFSFTREGRKITVAIPDVRLVLGPRYSGDLSITLRTNHAEQLMSYFESLGGTPR